MKIDSHLLSILSIGYQILIALGVLMLIYLTIWLFVIISKYHKAANYNNFVKQYYGRIGKETPMMILRIQNSYIEEYNHVHDSFVGRLFHFKPMPGFTTTQADNKQKSSSAVKSSHHR